MKRQPDSRSTEPGTASDVLLADIATWTGMPFANLVYRELAARPARLEACWSRLLPGLAAGGADDVRTRLLGPRRDRADDSDLGLVLDTYDGGNTCNAVLVRLLLDGALGQLHEPATTTAPRRTPAAVVPRRPLPPMAPLDAMTPEARQRVTGLARLVDPSASVVPSLFRHLAHDLALLTAVDEVLRAADASGEFDRRGAELAATASELAASWPLPVEPVGDEETRALLTPFARAIPRMLAVSSLLRDRPL